MKKLTTLIALCITLLSSCSDNGEKKAADRLQQSRQALEANDFNQAKLHLDSIKQLYPKAFEARKAGVRLMQEIELKEQQHNLIYLDSVLQDKQAVFESIKNRFVLEKDAEYQTVGNYFWPTQVVEKNLNRSLLRFQVDEMGNMNMTSIYQGASGIRHYAVKVTAPDGTFAETPRSKDSYETSNLGTKIEQADYKLGQDGDVIKFIYFNKDKNLKVEYIGDRKYTTTMSANDRRALAEIYELSQLLSSIENVKKEAEEARTKIKFIERNIEKAKTEEGNEK